MWLTPYYGRREVNYSGLLLFQQPVLRNIPGVPFEYIPSMGAQQAWGLYQKVYLAAWGMLGFLMALSYVLNICGVLANIKTTWYDTLLRGLLAGVLLSIFPNFVFGSIIGSGNYIANQIFPQSEIAKLNEEFRAAAEREETARQNNAPFYQRWFEKLAAITALLTPSQMLLTELFLAVFTILFYVAVILIMLLWRLFVVLMFVVSPLLIVLSVLPGIGGRIGGAWMTALVQLSFWQVLMAVNAFFVRTADSFFQPQLDILEGRLTLTNHYESMAICFGFAILYLSLPFQAYAVFPISRFSAAATFGFEAGTQQAMNMANRVIQAASLVGGLATKGAGGGASGRIVTGGGAAAAGAGGGGGSGGTVGSTMGATGGGGGGGSGASGGGGSAATGPTGNTRSTTKLDAQTTGLDAARSTRDLGMEGDWR